jgi:hypothetical protein
MLGCAYQILAGAECERDHHLPALTAAIARFTTQLSLAIDGRFRS